MTNTSTSTEGSSTITISLDSTVESAIKSAVENCDIQSVVQSVVTSYLSDCDLDSIVESVVGDHSDIHGMTCESVEERISNEMPCVESLAESEVEDAVRSAVEDTELLSLFRDIKSALATGGVE